MPISRSSNPGQSRDRARADRQDGWQHPRLGLGGQGPAHRSDERLARRLRRRIALSQRVVERSARAIEGHETDPCPLEHPQVGRLRCGEWLLFAGVHDMMHLEQLHAIEAAFER